MPQNSGVRDYYHFTRECLKNMFPTKRERGHNNEGPSIVEANG